MKKYTKRTVPFVYDLYFLKDNEYIRIDKDSFEERVITHKELKTIKK